LRTWWRLPHSFAWRFGLPPARFLLIERCVMVALLLALAGMSDAVTTRPVYATADTSLAARIDVLLDADQDLNELFSIADLDASFATYQRGTDSGMTRDDGQYARPPASSVAALPAEDAAAQRTPVGQADRTDAGQRAVRAHDAATRSIPKGIDALQPHGLRLRDVYLAAAEAWELAAQPIAGPLAAAQAPSTGGSIVAPVHDSVPTANQAAGGMSDYEQVVLLRRQTALILLRDAAQRRLATRIQLVALRAQALGQPVIPVELNGNMTAVLGTDTQDASSASLPGDRRFGVVDAYEYDRAATDLHVGWERMDLDSSAEWVDHEVSRGRDVAALLMVPAGAQRVPPGLSLPFDDPGNAWGQEVRSLAHQFRGRVTAWIIGNEPDIWDRSDRYFTWAGSPDDYYQLLKTSYLAIKAADPDARVVVGGQTYWWDATQGRDLYLRRVLDAAARDPSAPSHGWYFDAVSLHLYSAPEDLAAVPQTYQLLLHQYGLHKALWVGETNAVPWNAPGQLLPRGEYRVTLDEQASYVIQALSCAITADVERIEMYKMVDVRQQSEPFGLFSQYSGMARPAAQALKTAAIFFNGVHSGRLRKEAGVDIVEMQSDGYDITVAWSRDAQTHQMDVPAAMPFASLIDLNGQVRVIQSHNAHYALTLPSATANTVPGQPDVFPVGGIPVILAQQREGQPGSPR